MISSMEIFLQMAIVALVAIIASSSTWFLSIKKLPVSHRVAILGFPRSGKTSLIVAIFEYYFRRGALGKIIAPRGEETIRRINENINRLELRKEISPTKDQDVFAYRADIYSEKSIFSRRYKLEIGDYPGEDTVAFAEDYGDWLHQTPYFKWATSADAFIFVVDAEIFFCDDPKQEAARQKSAFRAAWQRLREHHLDGRNDLESKTLVLVFTKIDLFIMRERNPNWPVSALTAEQVLTHYFKDLIEYLNRETTKFYIEYTSVYEREPAGNRTGERFGIPELAERILPKLGLYFSRKPNPVRDQPNKAQRVAGRNRNT